MAYSAKIFLYPIKSLESIEVNETTILSSDLLKYDRALALIDAQHRVVNASFPGGENDYSSQQY
jgi:uncharacterized protein